MVSFFAMYTATATSVIDALVAIMHVAGYPVPTHESFEQRAQEVTKYVADCALKALHVSRDEDPADLADPRFDIFLTDETKRALGRKRRRARKQHLQRVRDEILEVLGQLESSRNS